jgi:hypothetical protein
MQRGAERIPVRILRQAVDIDAVNLAIIDQSEAMRNQDSARTHLIADLEYMARAMQIILHNLNVYLSGQGKMINLVDSRTGYWHGVAEIKVLPDGGRC